jgi:hypothetical protein
MEELKIRFPTTFKKVIDSPHTEEVIREVVEKYNGEIVLVKDTHNCVGQIEYLLGVLSPNNNKTYFFQSLNQKRSKRLHYNDLEELIVPSPSSPHILLST